MNNDRQKPKKVTNPWGRDDLMATAAVRYCLGRMTYIVGDCADWLIEHWPNISSNARAVIQRDVEERFEQDDRNREACAKVCEGDLSMVAWQCADKIRARPVNEP